MQTFPGTTCSTGEMNAEEITNANAALIESLDMLADEMKADEFRRDETSIAVLKAHIATMRRMLGPFAAA